jgi:putative aminopeptidase FrvX
VKKRTKKQQASDAARIQRAVTGMLIPVMSIPKIYTHAEKLIADGADDEQLANGVRAFMAAQS